MTKEELLQLIGKGENQTVEFKKAKDTLPNSIWETYSAFANTDGGLIILGVAEQKGEFIADGVTAPDKIIKEFWNLVNNQQKVSVNILFDTHVRSFLVDNKTFIRVEIPRANRQEKPVYINNNLLTGSFRRNFEGDFRCSNAEVKAMLRDQADVSVDFTVFSEIDYADLLSDTFRRYRIRFKNLKPTHIWNNLNDEEFILKIGAVRRIENLFALVGIGERAGSGLHAIHYIWNEIGFPKPKLNETFNPERISFVLEWRNSEKSSEKMKKGSEKMKKGSEKTSDKIIFHINDNKYITIAELAQLLGISTRAVEKQIDKLKSSHQIQRKGPDKGGYWEVIQ